MKQGKVRYIGCSNFSAAQLHEAQKVSAEKNLAAFVSSQDEYSLLARTIERELLPAIEHYGMAELPYFPLASGLLTGKYKQVEAAPEGSRLAQKKALAEKFQTAANMEKVARARSVCRSSAATLCWSWHLAGCWRGLRWRA